MSGEINKISQNFDVRFTRVLILFCFLIIFFICCDALLYGWMYNHIILHIKAIIL